MEKNRIPFVIDFLWKIIIFAPQSSESLYPTFCHFLNYNYPFSHSGLDHGYYIFKSVLSSFFKLASFFQKWMHFFCFLKKMMYLILRQHLYCDFLTLIKLTFYYESTPYHISPLSSDKISMNLYCSCFCTFRNFELYFWHLKKELYQQFRKLSFDLLQLNPGQSHLKFLFFFNLSQLKNYLCVRFLPSALGFYFLKCYWFKT